MELASYKTSEEYDLLIGCWLGGSTFVVWMLTLIYLQTWYNVFLPTLTEWLYHQSPLFRIELFKSVFTRRMWDWGLSRRVRFDAYVLCNQFTNVYSIAIQASALLNHSFGYWQALCNAWSHTDHWQMYQGVQREGSLRIGFATTETS
jgi:hypothetical protein